jgi:hypothetical protein
MEEFSNYVLRPGVITLAVAVVIATFFIKRVVELRWPSLKKTASEMEAAVMYASKAGMWWREVVLYAIPVLLGASASLMDSEFIHGPITGLGNRAMFCSGIGWSSGFLYKIARKVILQKTGVDITSTSIAPSPPEDTTK